MPDTPVQVPVDQAEYAKFCYLIKVMDALDRADARAEEDIEHFRRTEGVKADRFFDWTIVTRHCAPQLLVSFLQGAERWEEDRMFRKHPHTVIVPRNAFVVELDEPFELTLEGHDADNDVTGAGDALRALRLHAQQHEGAVAMNADKLLSQLARVLKIK